MLSVSLPILAMTLFACNKTSDNTDYTELVNPFIGTDFTGNTYPGAQVPFGMVQLSPDNGISGWDRIAGYFYPDSTIAGFSHTHLSGTGAGDLYDISFMPVTFPVRMSESPLGIHSRFSHDRENASAGYYQVWLDDYDINVELTATERCGIQRYTFPGGKAAIILNLTKAMNWDATQDSGINITDSTTITGYRFSDGWARDQKIWFATRFSQPWDSICIDTKPIINNNDTIGQGTVAWFYFNPTKSEQITISTALSCTGEKGAMTNLLEEVPENDFNLYREKARDKWNSELSKINVTGQNKNDIVNFYTALYHSMLAPTIYCDIDGSYRGPDRNMHNSSGWINYSTFSLWDTFRASHPLFTIIQPDRTSDMVNSLVAFGQQNGRLPVWNMHASETDMMIGHHAIPVIVDAWLKGLVKGLDANKVLDLCVATANNDSYRQVGEYRHLGYVPYDIPDKKNPEEWSLSKTLEYAYDDYCIAVFADSLGRKDVAKEFYLRSQNYRNVFNPATGFMQPRDSSGEFIDNFSPEEYSRHICESNAWQYLWSVQHDIDGLIFLIGGKERFHAKLDSMMTTNPVDTAGLPIFSTGMIGQYVHGNEPSHHVIYLYNKAGRPDKTQFYVSKVMNELYKNEPSGLCGNEDCGQMSAWYIFSALGFYPVNPVGGIYEIGTPLFEKAEISLPNGKKFTVNAKELSKQNIYIKSIKINGKPYGNSYITHDMIVSGATIDIEMGPSPE